MLQIAFTLMQQEYLLNLMMEEMKYFQAIFYMVSVASKER